MHRRKVYITQLDSIKQREVDAEDEPSFRAGHGAWDNESTRCAPPFGFGK